MAINTWSTDEVRDWIAEFNEEALLAEGFEEAIVGVCERFGLPPVVAYDREACIDILIEDFLEDDTTGEINFQDLDTDLMQDAIDYFEYNVIGSGMGDNTPVFITFLPQQQPIDDDEEDVKGG